MEDRPLATTCRRAATYRLRQNIREAVGAGLLDGRLCRSRDNRAHDGRVTW
jgi:hypothetical protein